MRMKKKLRRAFRSAAPDVLSSVLQDLPETEHSPHTRIAPSPEKTHRFREFVATAAILALLVGVFSGTAWLIRREGGFASAQNPSIDSGTQDSAATDPTDPLILGPVSEQDIVSYLWDLVAADFFFLMDAEPDQYMAEHTKVGIVSDQATTYYRIEISHLGYTYIFDVECGSGEMISISIPITDSVKYGYVSQDVAVLMAYLACADQVGGAWKENVELLGTGTPAFYSILISSTTELCSVRCYVNACTGQIVDPEDVVYNTEGPSDPIDEIGSDLAIQLALEYAGYTRDEVRELNCVYDGSSLYWINFKAGICLYEIVVHANTGEFVYSNKSELKYYALADALPEVFSTFGTSWQDVWELQVTEEADAAGPHYLIDFTDDCHQAQVRFDAYGGAITVINEIFSDVSSPDTDLEHVIGWRVARDICLDLHGLAKDQVTSFRFEFITKENGDNYYEIHLNNDITAQISAKNGTLYGSGSSAAILTEVQISGIVLMDLDDEVRENCIAGAYDDQRNQCELLYAGGMSEGNVELQYRWWMYAGGKSYIYMIDAFTGEILSRDIFPGAEDSNMMGCA